MNPVIGRECIAYTTVEPYYGQKEGIPYAVTNRKYFVMENIISKASDIHGDCKFENLTIRGGFSTAFIHIAVDGLSKLWSTSFDPNDFSINNFPPNGIYPITLTNDIRIEVI
jgi:hypothetical protein